MSVSLLDHPKRGYLANILSIPPLIYPFQYNPTQISDSKSLKYRVKTPQVEVAAGVTAGAAALTLGAGVVTGGVAFSALGSTFKQVLENLGRTFSRADLHELESEGDRTLNFKFVIDGREKRPGEPERRRNEDGDILADLAILRSFVYPKLGDLLDLLGAAFGSDRSQWINMWFKGPPTALLVLGSTSIEGFVTELKINETLFNSELAPLRAEVDVTMIEKIDSLSFIIDSFKRIGLTFYHTAYEDIGEVLI